MPWTLCRRLSLCWSSLMAAMARSAAPLREERTSREQRKSQRPGLPRLREASSHARHVRLRNQAVANERCDLGVVDRGIRLRLERWYCCMGQQGVELKRITADRDRLRDQFYEEERRVDRALNRLAAGG